MTLLHTSFANNSSGGNHCALESKYCSAHTTSISTHSHMTGSSKDYLQETGIYLYSACTHSTSESSNVPTATLTIALFNGVVTYTKLPQLSQKFLDNSFLESVSRSRNRLVLALVILKSFVKESFKDIWV
jgi:hypothetical protein